MFSLHKAVLVIRSDKSGQKQNKHHSTNTAFNLHLSQPPLFCSEALHQILEPGVAWIQTRARWFSSPHMCVLFWLDLPHWGKDKGGRLNKTVLNEPWVNCWVLTLCCISLAWVLVMMDRHHRRTGYKNVEFESNSSRRSSATFYIRN